MALSKRCGCQDKDRCSHPWHARVQHKDICAQVALANWWGAELRNKTQATEAHAALVKEVRERTFNKRGRIGLVTKITGALDVVIISKLVDEFYTRHLLRKRKVMARNRYDTIAKPIVVAFGDLPVAALTEDMIEDLKVKLFAPRMIHGQVKAPEIGTVNKPLAFLKSLLNKARHWKYITAVPDFELDEPDNDRDQRISPAEEAALLQHAPPWLRGLIIIALYTGIRAGAMLALNIGDVDLRLNRLRMLGKTAKGNRTTYVSINDPMLRAVVEWYMKDDQGNVRPVAAPLFQNRKGNRLHYTTMCKAWWRTVLKANGHVPTYYTRKRKVSKNGSLMPESCRRLKEIDLHWHDLRREFASRHAERGTPITIIQALLHHRNVTTTMRYIKHTLARLEAAGTAVPVPLFELPTLPVQATFMIKSPKLLTGGDGAPA